MQERKIRKLIGLVENRLYSKLCSMCKAIFDGIEIPSHDYTHHIRCWKKATGVIEELAKMNLPFKEEEIENIIIAIFFHDCGMTKTLEKSHGIESRKLCERWLHKNMNFSDGRVRQILDAVELHDNKEYHEEVYEGLPKETNKVYNVLCISDDLDAFGVVGIFRYAEIYWLRGVPKEMIPKMVLENIQCRYLNFRRIFKEETLFVIRYRKMYEEVVAFYKRLFEQKWGIVPLHKCSEVEAKIMDRMVSIFQGQNVMDQIHFLAENAADEQIRCFYIKLYKACGID